MSSIHYFCLILLKLEFASQIFENTQISNSLRIYIVGTKFFHVERQTHMMKLIVALEFCKYA